jgi:hypothetical protein
MELLACSSPTAAAAARVASGGRLEGSCSIGSCGHAAFSAHAPILPAIRMSADENLHGVLRPSGAECRWVARSGLPPRGYDLSDLQTAAWLRPAILECLGTDWTPPPSSDSVLVELVS